MNRKKNEKARLDRIATDMLSILKLIIYIYSCVKIIDDPNKSILISMPNKTFPGDLVFAKEAMWEWMQTPAAHN